MKKPFSIFLFLTLLLFALSCSQTKNTWVNRQFHNVTAHYNGYYWARENIKEGKDKIERATPDDFGKLIPLFVYGDEKTVKSNVSYFDKTLEKESRVIKYHSMLIKGKEYCRWIDENYLVLAQAHFYKKEYYDAIDVLEYIVRTYPKSETKYRALLWLIRTYNAQTSVLNTQATIDLIAADKAFPKKLGGEFASLKAEYFLMMGNNEKAVQELKRAIPETTSKKQKARFIYVLAQIEEMKGNTKQATEYYKECASLHPPYEMYFSSKIKRALTVQGDDATAKVKKELKKMLKDDKNYDFRDQIYYAMAEIAIKEKDTVTAMKDLALSTGASVQNTRQRGVSYLREADIYFQQTEYQLAQAYYDSAIGFLPKDFKDYDFIVSKKNSLTGLVKNLETIQHEDSILKVAALDTNKRNALIKKIIDDLTAQEKRIEEEKKLAAEKKDANGNSNFPNTNNGGNTGNTPTPGAWYFYNSSSISFGFSDFVKKWGGRTLEDNWRRSNKETVAPTEVDPVVDKKDTVKKNTTVADNHKKEYYLKGLPFTDEAKEESKSKIIEAYNNVGGIYKEQLRNLDRSIETFELLNKRFPGNKYELQNYYQLYRLFLLKKNQKQSDYYKDLIVTKYPNTEFARIIKNPDYNKQLQASKHIVEDYYQQTFTAYNNGKYNDVLAMVTQADSLYGGSELMPKFALLRAYSIGRTSSLLDYENALTKIIIKYPKDPAKKRAQELIDEIKKFKSGKGNDTLRTGGADTVKALFNFEGDVEHWVMIILPNGKKSVNDFKAKVSDFNTQYFPLANLSVFSTFLGMDYQVVTIRAFENSIKAMDYYALINSDQNVFKDVEQNKVSLSVITQDNYKTFFTQKKKAEYEKFFKENYGKK